MRKDQIAELILSLFTSPERAASLVGDFLEDASARGDFWFWGCVLRTVFALLWHDLTAESAFLTGLAFRGILFGLGLLIIWLLLLVVGLALFAIVLFQIRGTGDSLPAWVPVEAGAKILSDLVGLTAVVVIQYRIGQWLARRAQGREMAACAAYELLNFFLWSALISFVYSSYGAELGKFAQTFHPQPASNQAGAVMDVLYSLACNFGIFAGAIRVRRQRVSA